MYAILTEVSEGHEVTTGIYGGYKTVEEAKAMADTIKGNLEFDEMLNTSMEMGNEVLPLRAKVMIVSNGGVIEENYVDGEWEEFPGYPMDTDDTKGLEILEINSDVFSDTVYIPKDHMGAYESFLDQLEEDTEENGTVYYINTLVVKEGEIK